MYTAKSSEPDTTEVTANSANKTFNLRETQTATGHTLHRRQPGLPSETPTCWGSRRARHEEEFPPPELPSTKYVGSTAASTQISSRHSTMQSRTALTSSLSRSAGSLRLITSTTPSPLEPSMQWRMAFSRPTPPVIPAPAPRRSQTFRHGLSPWLLALLTGSSWPNWDWAMVTSSWWVLDIPLYLIIYMLLIYLLLFNL